MIKVFEAQHPTEAYWVLGLLRAAGIAAEIRGESLLTTVEASRIIPGCLPSLWILEERRLDQAMDLIARYSKGEAHRGPGVSWKCGECGELLEPQFTDCWKCGTAG